MQNVVWPSTIVHVPSVGKSTMPIVDRSAMPVTMPGRAIGSTMMNASASRPRNRER
jgi:hypothetical protein